MESLRALWASTLGKKAVMAVTGLVMVLYLVGHVSANLAVFGGPTAINAYAAFLHEGVPWLLWGARVVLLASVLLHIAAAVSLTARDLSARPVAYRIRSPRAATWGSRTMRVGGVLIALFIVFHVLHMTTGTIRPAPFVRGDVYQVVVGGFRVPWVVGAYLVALAAVGLHLYHGDWAWFRSLGLARPSPNPPKRGLSVVVAGLVWLGFSLIPVLILLGVG